MNVDPDKGELKARRRNYGPVEWSLASPAPGVAARFRRWNLVLIALLAFLVLGAFVAAEAPRSANDVSNAANATQKENANPSSVQHANSIKGAQPEIHDIHSRTGSDDLHPDVQTGRHAG